MPKQGINKEDLAQMMDTNYALGIVNYIPYRYGLDKRKGLTNIFERAGANPITLLKEFTENVWIFGYSTKIEAYNTSTETFTTIKDDFSANDGFDGDDYGNYFFVCNGVEKIWRIESNLTISEIATSPICNGLKAIGARMYAFNLSTDASAIQYSEVDDGSNPPFDAWTQTTASDTGGTINYRNAKTARSVVQLGDYTVGFFDKGFAAWRINTIDSAGTLKKFEQIQNYTEDYGGARGAIETNFGIFYNNEAGLWQMVAVGQTDVPMSKQQVLVSTLLGSDFFRDTDQSSSDIVYDANLKCVFVTLAKDSPFNNVVIGCKPELKNSMFRFQNWNINRFAKSGEDIYGASSVKTTVYKLFDGYDDDGLKIGTEYYQELPLGSLFHAHSLSGIYAGGQLTPGDELMVRFDTFDLDGNIVYDKEKYKWTGGESNLAYDEWASAQWAGSGWGGSSPDAGLVESFGGGSPRVNNLQRLRVRITGGSMTRHILNWISAKTRQKQPIKRRNFTRITT
jgi:hypothetical protein